MFVWFWVLDFLGLFCWLLMFVVICLSSNWLRTCVLGLRGCGHAVLCFVFGCFGYGWILGVLVFRGLRLLFAIVCYDLFVLLCCLEFLFVVGWSCCGLFWF